MAILGFDSGSKDETAVALGKVENGSFVIDKILTGYEAELALVSLRYQQWEPKWAEARRKAEEKK